MRVLRGARTAVAITLAAVTMMAFQASPAGAVPASSPTISLNGLPTALHVGAAATGFTGTITNSGSAQASNVRVDFAIDTTSDPALTASELTLTYNAGAGGAGTIPLTGGGSSQPITGTFGPSTGFPLPSGYNATTDFAVSVASGAPSGSVAVTANLDSVDGNGSVTGTLATTGA